MIWATHATHDLLFRRDNLLDIARPDALDVLLEAHPERVQAVVDAVQQVVHAIQILLLVLVEQTLELFLEELGVRLDEDVLARADELPI